MLRTVYTNKCCLLDLRPVGRCVKYISKNSSCHYLSFSSCGCIPGNFVTHTKYLLSVYEQYCSSGTRFKHSAYKGKVVGGGSLLGTPCFYGAG